MAFATRPSQQFQAQDHDAVVLYGTIANQIREFKSLNISDKLIAFFNGYSELQNRNPEMVRRIEGLMVRYQEIEVEAQRYVMKAREFAQENNLVAQNVLDGKRYYQPLSILKNFQKTAEKLDQAFKVVVNKHSEVERSIASISRQAKDAGRQAGRLAIEADRNVLCNIPVAGVLVAPGIKAAQWADEVDHPVAKGFAGLAGFVSGILQGAISTALLGIPAYAAAGAKERLERLQKKYNAVVEFMEKFDRLVKNHKDLLNNISVRVSLLPSTYLEFEEGYKSGKLELYQIDLFKNTCNNIIEACDTYLTRYKEKGCFFTAVEKQY